MANVAIPTCEYKDFSSALSAKAHARHRVIKAQVELTYNCNLHCVHCYTDCYNQADLIRDRELGYEEITRVFDQLHEQGILWMCLTGGEIFMRHDFFDIYAYAKQKGFLISLFTNATLITERVADYLKEHPPFKIDISLHAATEETFDKITQVRGSFRRFQEGLRLLLERGLPVRIKTKAMTLNTHELDEIKKFVESLGLQFHVTAGINPRLNGDLGACDVRLSPEEIVELEEHFYRNCDHEECREEVGGWHPTPPPDDRLYRCGCGTSGVHISAWGELGTCTWQHHARANLRETSVADGIIELFPRIRALRYVTDSPCRQCSVFQLCEKDVNIAWAEADDPEQPVEHFCQTAFKRADRLQARHVFAHPSGATRG
jgi:radical SAM protein with 4Fe4S-binding SPASM domain